MENEDFYVRECFVKMCEYFGKLAVFYIFIVIYDLCFYLRQKGWVFEELSKLFLIVGNLFLLQYRPNFWFKFKKLSH